MSSEIEIKEIPKKRIFINNVDLYQSYNIAKYLSTCVVGSSLEEVDDDEEEQEEDSSRVKLDGTYEILGTMKNSDSPKPSFVKEIVPNSARSQLYEVAMECDVIIYDITEEATDIDEAVWFISELHADLDNLDKNKPRTFILLSTVLTWARSKPLDPDDPEIPFTEDDYRRRKPHPDFKEHISAEKLVMKFGKTNKSKLSTYVVVSGLTYGAGESIFHYLFKAAWHNNNELLCYGNGDNIIPMIHIKDLAGVLQNIADSRPKVRYVIAVDESKSSLFEIVKTISKNLATGKVKKIPKEEALLNKELKQLKFDMLLVNLRMDAVFIKENMNIKWVSEAGLVENIGALVKEYKETRNLQPIKIMVLGTPCSGKTSVSKLLCSQYKLHHVTIKDVIDEALERLRYYASRREVEEEEAADEEEQEMDEDEEAKILESEELLEAINENKEQNNGRIDDQYVINFVREKLRSKPCQNQGYVMDGFPKLFEQAKDLFSAEDVDDDDEERLTYDRATMPDTIFNLEASDEFLKERVMNLPESAIVGTHNTEEGLLRRLTDYRSTDNEEDTVLNYFDELEFHPQRLDVTSMSVDDIVQKITKEVGKPRNYGLTPEEREEQMRIEEEERLKREQEEKAEQEMREAEELALRRQRQEEWSKRLAEVKQEEVELLEVQSVPLRNYLMKHVMPTLTQGLIECCKVRPDDPVDYLAEYLFKNNPQID